jgi:hypothetical protein
MAWPKPQTSYCSLLQLAHHALTISFSKVGLQLWDNLKAHGVVIGPTERQFDLQTTKPAAFPRQFHESCCQAFRTRACCLPFHRTTACCLPFYRTRRFVSAHVRLKPSYQAKRFAFGHVPLRPAGVFLLPVHSLDTDTLAYKGAADNETKCSICGMERKTSAQ